MTNKKGNFMLPFSYLIFKLFFIDYGIAFLFTRKLVVLYKT